MHINCPPAETDSRLKQVLADLCRAIGAERAAVGCLTLGTMLSPELQATLQRAVDDDGVLHQSLITPSKTAKKTAAQDPDIATLERELAEKLAAKVTIRHGSGGKGQLVIRYHSVDELEGILERIR